MTVEKLDSSSLIAALDAEDMAGFGLEENNLSLKNERCRRIILHVAKLACLSAGVDHAGKSLSIDIFLPGGACWLLVEAVPKRAGANVCRRKAPNGRSVCGKFSNVSDFLAAVELMYRQKLCCGKASAYLVGGEYYLIFDYPSLPEPFMKILSEFSQRIDNPAGVREAGRVICTSDAVEIIGKHLV